jgi:hypothetical protein
MHKAGASSRDCNLFVFCIAVCALQATSTFS